MAWELLIPAIAAGLSLIAIGLEVLMHDRDKAKTIELTIRKKQREIKKHQKDKDTKAMMEANKELMSLMGQNMRLKMKTMFISMPLFLVIFWVLSGVLNVAPLYAGETSQIGASIRNLDASAQTVILELVSDGITVSGANAQTLELDDQGDLGDRMVAWWNVTAAEGRKEYKVKAASSTLNKSDEKSYPVSFEPKGSLFAGFTPAGASTLLGEKAEITPLYKGVEVNIAGIVLPWIWYYILSYFILGALLTPLKNRLLWGHHKGIKHIEKQESQNEAKEK